jgi:hypothetical protein
MYWLCDPTVPLAIPSAMWFSFIRAVPTTLSNRHHTLFGFRLPPEYCLA